MLADKLPGSLRTFQDGELERNNHPIWVNGPVQKGLFVDVLGHGYIQIIPSLTICSPILVRLLVKPMVTWGSFKMLGGGLDLVVMRQPKSSLGGQKITSSKS